MRARPGFRSTCPRRRLGGSVSRPIRDQVLALAGLFQSALLVQRFAREGIADAEGFAVSIRSILAVDAASVSAVYGGTTGLRIGLEHLRDAISGRSSSADVEVARYVVWMLHLESRLRRRQGMLDAIRKGIETARSQMRFFGNSETEEAVHPRLVEKLAELYSQTISTLVPRIMVSGEHVYLANPAIAAKVRALLLAGIRSAVLWRQIGGNRWQLMFRRRRIAQVATELLAAQAARRGD